jgi:hypothetical protein
VITAGDATDEVRTGLAGRIANRIAALFGSKFSADSNDSKGLNALCAGVVDPTQTTGGSGGFAALPAYPTNADALAGGLVPGQLYRSGSDPDVVCVVH